MEPIVSVLLLLAVDDVDTDRAQVIFDLCQVSEDHGESVLSDGFAHLVLGMEGTLHEGSRRDIGGLPEEGFDCVSEPSLVQSAMAGRRNPPWKAYFQQQGSRGAHAGRGRPTGFGWKARRERVIRGSRLMTDCLMLDYVRRARGIPWPMSGF